MNTVYNTDCIAGMAALPEGCVDLLITDPPFGIDFSSTTASYNRAQEYVLPGYTEVPADDYAEFTLNWLSAASHALKPDASGYIVSGWNQLRHIENALAVLEWPVINHIIWQYAFGVRTKNKFVSAHYHILYFCRNPRKRKFNPWCRHQQDDKDSAGGSLHYQDKQDVWQINKEYWPGREKTPTKLPRALIEKMLQYSSDPDDVILDPFLGSGQVAVVSALSGRQYVGFEVVPAYFDFIERRLTSGTYLIESRRPVVV